MDPSALEMIFMLQASKDLWDEKQLKIYCSGEDRSEGEKNAATDQAGKKAEAYKDDNFGVEEYYFRLD
jgi:hypothetical protein